MPVKSIELTNIRSFTEVSLDFSPRINLLIGRNNSGKSSILLPLLGLQANLRKLQATDVRLTQSTARAQVSFSAGDVTEFGDQYSAFEYEYLPGQRTFRLSIKSPNPAHPPQLMPHLIPAKEPSNLIYPFLSDRKVIAFDHKINQETATAIHPDLRNLYAKIDRVVNPGHRVAGRLYSDICTEALGFIPTTDTSPQGKEVVLMTQANGTIPLSSMGAGAPNILALAALLATASNRIIVIEEPENDLHPSALRALLDVIISQAAHNQFFITTHSNIVLRTLGAARDAKVFYITSDFVDGVPTSEVHPLGDCLAERRAILEDLGYDLSDLGLWHAWLLLEEASAERIIRDYLIPWFACSLDGKLRTFSAQSATKLKSKFDDFNSLFVFLHLEPTYKNRAWVLIDDGPDELQILQKLRSTYCTPDGWNATQFRQLKFHDFECYYPSAFKEETDRILHIADRRRKYEAKQTLLQDVLKWIGRNGQEAKDAFAESANEVIDILKDIERQLNKEPM
jgi:energy-coupling factor transporter ATP-binding protein EcfA2